MSHHIIERGTPIQMGRVAEYACSCGRRGTQSMIERHIAEMTNDDFSEDTKSHYLPVEPRRPAPPTSPPSPPSPPIEQPDPPSRSIAEAFQDMLRVAYGAGIAAAATGESFEAWYQREVLR